MVDNENARKKESKEEILRISVVINKDGSYEYFGDIYDKTAVNAVKKAMVVLCAQKLGLFVVPKKVFDMPIDELIDMFEDK